jgi:Polyketide synthase modules and related proteins
MFNNHTQHANIVSVLQSRLGETDKHIVFVKDSRTEEHVAYGQLITEAQGILAYLNTQGIKKGHELIIQIEDERAYLTVFTACLLGSIIAVPLATGSQEEHVKKVRKVWDKMNHPHLYTHEKIKNRLDNFFTGHSAADAAWWQQIQEGVLLMPQVVPEAQGEIQTDAHPDDVAYIQFSSGSTGDPKGVRVSNLNVLCNTDGMLNASKSTADETIISWLPLTHDMGLVGCFLCGICGNLKTVIIPTSLFIKKPFVWMDKMHEHRGNISFSPNFGYKYFLQELQNRQPSGEWKLDSLRIIYNGAEQISYSIINNFLQMLGKYGLRNNCILTGYGLAEATLTVSIHEPGAAVEVSYIDRAQTAIGDKITLHNESSDDTIAYVSCGRSINDTRIRICDVQHNVLEEGRIGLVQLEGQSITSGYYGQPEYPLYAHDGWLQTGDLGFFSDGKLYITGRQKEMIIINGMNFYPYDIEKLLEDADAQVFALTRTAAASIIADGGEERLIVFVLWRGSGETFLTHAEQVRKTILKQLGLVVHDVVPVKRIPKTTSGKLQRRKLADDYLASLQEKAMEGTSNTLPVQEQSFIELIKQEITNLFGLTHVSTTQTFTEQGFDSLRGTELVNALNKKLNIRITPTIVYEYPTITQLAKYLSSTGVEEHGTQNVQQKQHSTYEPIAIVGMSGIFPGGAANPEELWELLTKGTDTVVEIPESRWDNDDFYSEQQDALGKTNTKYASLIDGIDMFDAEFFGISPREAASLDPQQRMLLEVSFNALQNAGYNLPSLQNSNTGVFIGLSHSDYTQAHIHSGQPDTIDAYSLTGTINSTAAGRLSYYFNLSGPALIIDTACSSSLVAVHYAARSLQAGDCDMAIAGGVNAILAPEPFISLTKIQALSPDGRCKTFDETANGYGRGEGCGIIVLKRLSDAERDNDNILGILRASAINQDGKSNGLTAPNGIAQQKLLQKAIDIAGIAAERIAYVEAHGTGTPLGDPLELQAMYSVYGSAQRTLLTGSIKSNIGHLESAAGIAGLTKILLSFRHGSIPGNLHFKTPNGIVPWDKLNIKIADTNIPWQQDKEMLAGISSFGFSGTNAHLILEGPAKKTATTYKRATHICSLSAHTSEALQQQAKALSTFIQNSDHTIGDICYNTNRRNNLLRFGWQATCDTKAELLDQLQQLADSCDGIIEKSESNQLIAFQFTGQGSQYAGMGKELYEDFEVYRAAIDECSAIYGLYNNGISLKEILFEDPKGIINQTRYAQPTLFCTGYALAKLLESYGIQPGIVLGHSLGEITAACIAGAVTMQDAIKLISARAALMQEQPTGGGMISVIAPEHDVIALIQASNINLSIAGINSGTQTVVSGLLTEIEKLRTVLSEKNIIAVPLTVSHAFHSPLMKPAADKLTDTVEQIQFFVPSIPIISNITGKNYTQRQLDDTSYWSQHLLSPVRYAASLNTLKQLGYQICIELGPQPVLTNLGKQNQPEIENWIPSLRKGVSATKQFLLCLASIQHAGIPINWKQGEEHDNKYNYVQLPDYTFQKKRHWKHVVVGKHSSSEAVPEATTPLYSYEFETIPQPAATGIAAHIDIIYNKNLSAAKALSNQLALANANYTTQHIDEYQRKNTAATTIYLADDIGTSAATDTTELAKLLAVVKQFAKSPDSKLIVLTSNVHSNNSNVLNLHGSLLWGFGISVKAEMQELDISVVDTDDTIANCIDIIQRYKSLPVQLLIKGNKWLAPKMAIVADTNRKRLKLKSDGHYLVTGGLGSIGKLLIDWLISKGAKNITLLNRRQPTASEQEQVAQWNAKQCSTHVIVTDISNIHTLRNDLKDIDTANVKGIFHVAGIINDRLINAHDAESFQSVFPVKIEAASNLHEISKDWKLDHFALFSSTVSLFGNRGQTNYGAANYFLNRLAAQRIHDGLPAVSICWGPWEDSRMTKGLNRSFEQMGVHLITKKMAAGLFEQTLNTAGTGTLVAIDVKPDIFMANCPAWLRPMMPAAWHAPVANTAPTMELSNTDDTIAMLARMGKNILKLGEHDTLNVHRPYFEIGFDSLMLNMLKGQIQKETGINIPIAYFFQHTTLSALGKYLYETSGAKNDSSLSNEPINLSTAHISAELHREVEMLSDEEITKLLNRY